MKNFLTREIWLPIDVNGDAEAQSLNGGFPLVYKGGEFTLRLALFDRLPVSTEDPGEFRNHSNLTAFLAKVRSSSYAGSLLLDSGDAAAIAAGATIEIIATTTEANFYAREKAPINIFIPASVAANLTAGTLYMAFTGQTSESSGTDGFGRTQLSVVDIGIADSATPPEPAEQFVSVSAFNAAMQNVVKFGRNKAGKTLTLVSRNGTRGRTLGTDDNGRPIDALERLP